MRRIKHGLIPILLILKHNIMPIQNTLSTFADLYGANSAPKLKCRLELLDNEFIPSLGKDVIVEKDVARNFPDAWRMILWQRQDGICPLTGKTISQSDASDGNITHMDHIVPHSKGGKTIKRECSVSIRFCKFREE